MLSNLEIADALITRLRAGDPHAFNELFAIYRDEVRRFISVRLDGRLAQRLDSSDIVQETQLEAFRKLPDFLDREPMPFGIWIIKTAHQQLISARRIHINAQRRTVDREEGLPDRSSELIAAHWCDRMASPSHQISRDEMRHQVFTALADLDDVDREILLMRCHEGRPHSDIAMLLDIEPAAARKRYGRALLRLREALAAIGLWDDSP